MSRDGFRVESDSVVGDVRIPDDALYGPQTQTALDNFDVSDVRFGREFVRALGRVKRACADANVALGRLDEERGEAIRTAAGEVARGDHDDAFPLSVYQLGSGTNTNMNANEVIANRAAELLDAERGSRVVHPNDHVNMGQSSNDVIPTTIHVAALTAVEERLLPTLDALAETLDEKATEFDDVVKLGRTHLQDATPIRLGQEFSGYASQIAHGIDRVEAVRESLSELAIGGTAVGTGLNTLPEFPGEVVERLNEATGLQFREAPNHFEAQAARDAVVEASGALKTVAVSLMKIANDLRWLSCGPRAGFDEIDVPTVQPAGSSIMPGKMNPVVLEITCQAAAQVVGNDATITVGGQSGNFEINVMKPVMATNLLQSVRLLTETCTLLAEKCVSGIEANEDVCERYAESSLSLVTALAPHIGYDAASDVAEQALREERTIEQVALDRGVLTEAELDRVLDPRRMTDRGVPGPGE
ncbi:MAG: class II fumarate hydratase [Haloferacaceae archaeon]